MKACGSIAKWVTIGKRVGALDDEVGVRRRFVDVAPAEMVLAQDVGPGQRVAAAGARVLDQRRRRVEGAGDREDRRQFLVLDLDEPRRRLGGVEGLGRDGRDRLAVVLGLADGQDRAGRRTGARSAASVWGRSAGGHDQADAGHGERRGRVDRHDPRPGAVERDELDVEHVGQLDVGHVLLRAR